MKTLPQSIIVSTLGISIILAFLILHYESDNIFTSQELTVDGLKETYNVGEQINFKIKFNELLGSCTQPHITVKNQTDQIIWESKEIAVPCSTDTTLRHGEGELEFGNPDLGYLRINQTGSYHIHIWFVKEIVEKVTVIQSNNNDETHTNTLEKDNSSLSGSVSSYVYGGPLGSMTNRSSNYVVSAYMTDGITLAGKTISDSNAHYFMQLPAGDYIIYTYNEIKQKYVISISAGKNTVFNITSSIHVP